MHRHEDCGTATLTAVCDHPYDRAAAESCNLRHVGVTHVPDPCTKAPQCDNANESQPGSAALHWFADAVEWSVRRHTRPAGRGMLSQNRYLEWLNAKPFRSFRFAEP